MPGRLSQRLLGTRPDLYESMLQQGLSTSPIGHWTQGLARLAQAYVGMSGLKGLEEKATAEDEATQKAIMDAFAPRQEPGPELQGPVQPIPEDMKFFAPSDQAGMVERAGTRYELPVSPPVNRMPSMMEAAQGLMQNPGTQSMAAQLMMKSMEDSASRQAISDEWARRHRMERSEKQADVQGEREYQRGMGQEKFAQQLALNAQRGDMGIGGGMDPASVRTYKYMMSLPEEERAGFMATLRNPNYLNLGGQYGMPDPFSPGNIAGSISKTVPPEKKPEFQQEAERQKALGKEAGAAEGKAKAGLPDLVGMTEETIGLVDKALAHPGLSGAIGMPNILSLGGMVPGTKEADFLTLHDQLTGKTFLQAYQSLKGAGQITEFEGKRAAESIARMSRAQSEESYKAALKEFQEVLKIGLERARGKAGAQGGDTTPRRRKSDLPPGFEVQ